jgi:hypothetical protein
MAAPRTVGDLGNGVGAEEACTIGARAQSKERTEGRVRVRNMQDIELGIHSTKIVTFRFIQVVYSHSFTNPREKLIPIGESESRPIRGRVLQARR